MDTRRRGEAGCRIIDSHLSDKQLENGEGNETKRKKTKTWRSTIAWMDGIGSIILRCSHAKMLISFGPINGSEFTTSVRFRLILRPFLIVLVIDLSFNEYPCLSVYLHLYRVCLGFRYHADRPMLLPFSSTPLHLSSCLHASLTN